VISKLGSKQRDWDLCQQRAPKTKKEAPKRKLPNNDGPPEGDGLPKKKIRSTNPKLKTVECKLSRAFVSEWVCPENKCITLPLEEDGTYDFSVVPPSKFTRMISSSAAHTHTTWLSRTHFSSSVLPCLCMIRSGVTGIATE